MSSTENKENQLVSVIIPCLNEVKTISACVAEALKGLSTAGLRGEVVVADNGSTDGSQDASVKAEVQAEVELGKAIKVGQTPTMMVTHKLKKTPISGYVTYAIFKK